MRQEFWPLAAIAVVSGAALGVLGAPVHEAFAYGLAVLTGGLFGLGLARRR